MQKLSCTIRELTPSYFPCDCINTDDACMMRATPEVVCLRPDGDPSGGSKIWPDYLNHTHPPTPNPPTPTAGETSEFLKIYAAVVTTILILYGGTELVKCLIQTYRRRQYQRIQDQRPQAPTSGVPVSPESPYADN